jgi:hypothetical protein
MWFLLPFYEERGIILYMEMNVTSVEGVDNRAHEGFGVAMLAESLKNSEVQAEALMTIIESLPEMPEGVGEKINSLA